MFGRYPGFDLKGKTPVLERKLNGESVKWYSSDWKDTHYQFRLDTFVPKLEDRWIWVAAQDKKTLQHLLAITETMGFREDAN